VRRGGEKLIGLGDRFVVLLRFERGIAGAEDELLMLFVGLALGWRCFSRASAEKKRQGDEQQSRLVSVSHLDPVG
jgi:hypothetical protein